MRIAVIGVNHATATINIREKLSFTDTQKIEVLNQLLDYKIKEVVVLSTCNRSEIYICTQYIEKGIEYVRCIYEDFCKVAGIEEYIFAKVDEAAVDHLFRVAAGLESIVIGEDQILGQVKDAHELALEIGSSGKVLNKCFREAITTAKVIKSKTKISEYPLSISYIGVKFLKEKIGTMEGKSALLIGAGKMNRLALNHLYQEGVLKVYLANRTTANAYKLEEQYPNLTVIPFEERYEKMQDVDIVITSTASPHLVIKKDKVKIHQKQLHMLDLALPRDIDEKLKEHPQVELYDIDDLKSISDENNERRKVLAHIAEEFIKSSVSEFQVWLQTIKLDPTLQSLHERCDLIQKDTMHYIKRKVNLSCKEEKIVEKMVMSSLKRLIREPISNLKEIKDSNKQEAYIKLIEELFEL